MQRRQLGTTDIFVSEMALGCWPFIGGDLWEVQRDEDSIAAVHACLDAGVNFFDTAEGYGDGYSEQVLGTALEGRRDEAVVATKVGADHLVPRELVSACERSLHHLHTDYIDLYLIHWPNHDVPLTETLGALERLTEQGKIRAIGVCNFGAEDLADLLDVGHTEVDQLPYNLLWRPIEHEILPGAREHGIGLMVYSPLAQGLLAGRYATADEVPDGIARSRHFAATRPQAVHGEPGCEAEVFAAIDGVRQIAQRIGQPMADVSLSWVRQQQGVTSVLVGARSAREVELDLPAFELKLDEDVISELNAVTETVKRRLGTNPDMWRSEDRMR